MNLQLTQDQDPGPERAWRWAHQESTRSCFVMSYVDHKARERAYVMWDLRRLQDWNLFNEP